MPKDQILMGLAMAMLCLTGLVKDRWLLANTNKGRRLVGWLGETRALWLFRVLMGFGIVFGVLLAGNWIRPVHW